MGDYIYLADMELYKMDNGNGEAYLHDTTRMTEGGGYRDFASGHVVYGAGGGGSAAGSVTVGIGNPTGLRGTGYGGGGSSWMSATGRKKKYAIYHRNSLGTALGRPSNRTYLNGRLAIMELPFGMDDGDDWTVWLRTVSAYVNGTAQWSTWYLGTGRTWHAALMLAQAHYRYGHPEGWQLQGEVDILSYVHTSRTSGGKWEGIAG